MWQGSRAGICVVHDSTPEELVAEKGDRDGGDAAAETGGGCAGAAVVDCGEDVWEEVFMRDVGREDVCFWVGGGCVSWVGA